MDQDLLKDLDDLGEEEEEIEVYNNEKTDILFSITATFRSSSLKTILESIDKFLSKERLSFYNSGPFEQDREYQTIITSNLLNMELLNELCNVGKHLHDLYKPRFPELESLILNPIDYAKVIKLIGNEFDLSAVDLQSLLPAATAMIVLITSTTSTGKPLTELELENVITTANVLLEIDDKRNILLSYVQSRMSLIAPNLTILVGSECAAKLVGVAGGLTALSKVPSCNILILGAEKRNSIGLSSISMDKHAGYIYESELVLSSPKHIRRKAARLLSAKAALACRIDLSKEYQDGSQGLIFKEDVEKKISKLIEPPPAKNIKALPLPIEFKKRRGGKRARKAKERSAPSDLQKASNRMAFGEQEDGVINQYGETIGLGMVTGASGKLKLKRQEFKAPISKKHKLMTQFKSNNNPNSGLASSVAFTPIKGIELENPDQSVKKLEAINQKYFSGFKK